MSDSFYFKIVYDRKPFRLKAERLLFTDKIEQYKISSQHHSFTLQSNRPLLRNKGLKHRKPNWKIIDGKAGNSHLQGIIIAALMEVVDK